MTAPFDRLTAALDRGYRLERELGQGGMATVYLAHDLKHDRKVAIKVLHPELSAVLGAERFLAEIKTTANLQHPHILGLIDSGDADGLLYYVMPFVDGETLRTRLERERQLPVKDAVRLATEVANALEYAHKRGVVHRDIKPENILLQDGQALVADFGIALAVSQAGGARMTQTGLSLGTPSYMSPEQAMGEKTITARSDIYALGAMTYEMITGEPPFGGGTVQSIVAKVLTEKPIPPSRLRDTVPPAVEAAVLTALQKLPADRFATAREFAEALARDGTAAHAATRVLPAATAAPGPWRRVALLLGASTVAALALAGWAVARRPAAVGPTVYDAALPDSAPMAFAAATSTTGYGAAVRNLSVAPSGDFAVYAARQGESAMLWYRSLRTEESHPIAGTTGGIAPRVSPDGRQVAFLAGNRLVVAPLAGGEPRTLIEAQTPTYLDWESPTSLLVGSQDGYRIDWVDTETGTVRNRPTPRCVQGRWSPELRLLSCRINNLAALVDPESGTTWYVRTTAPGGGDGPLLVGSGTRVLDGGLLTYVSADGELRVAPYDNATHRIGRPVALAKGVRSEAVGEAHFDIAANGTLVFAPGVNAEVGRLVRYRPGTGLDTLTAEAGLFQRFDLSPDQRWLAAVTQGPDVQELRIYDLRSGQRTTWLRAEVVRQPLWDAAGDRIFVHLRNGAEVAVVSGAPGSASAPDTLFKGDSSAAVRDLSDLHGEHELVAHDWLRSVAYRTDPRVTPMRFDTLLTEARFVAVSPGGRLMSYMNLQGSAVMVTSHPVPGRRWQVAPDGAEPLWLGPGELLFRQGSTWFLTRLDPATGEPQGTPQPWARDPRFSDTGGWSNRPSRDGGIIYVQGPPVTGGTHLRVVPGWEAQARAAAAAANR